MTSFTGAERKIDRAREHVNALDKAINRFLETEPYAAERRLKARDRIHEYVLVRYTEPPDCLGLLVGDAVHNLRSALDHVAFELALKGAQAIGHTMTSEQARRIQYPVVDCSTDFKSQLNRGCLRYVESVPKAFIERHQPYNLNPEHPERTVLACLASLDNTDKHRTVVTTSHTVRFQPDYSGLPEGVPPPRLTLPRNATWGLGAVVARFTFTQPEPEVDMQFLPKFSIAIDGAWPPTRRADEVLDFYAGWIELFVLGQIREWARLNP